MASVQLGAYVRLATSGREPMPTILPYGAWPSPITAELITGRQVGLASPWLDGADAYWTESRPLEGGRTTLLRKRPGAAPAELTPAPFNLRTRVHEYGGRPFTVRDGVVVAVEFADQRLYRLDPDGSPVALTPESGGALRYADLVLDLPRGRCRVSTAAVGHPERAGRAAGRQTRPRPRRHHAP